MPIVLPRVLMADERRSGLVVQFPKPAGKSILQFRSQGKTAEVDFFGIVGGDFWGDGGITKEQFAAELKKLPAAVDTVTVRMSSPGGDVFDGRAIANMIRQHKARFEINVIAEASSAASIVAMAGDTVHMAEGAVMLVHRCYTITIGNAVELESLAKDLRTIDDEAVATYARKTGMKPQEIAALMDENRYMSAAECKEKGFCDTVDGPSPSQLAGLRIAAFDIDRAAFGLPPLPAVNSPRRLAAIAAMGRQKAMLGR